MAEIRIAVSGGFDPLHSGHLNLFKDAKKKRSKLIVFLNSDEFLERKKGRYFMNFIERREILKSNRYIDEVFPVIDTDDTVCETLIKYKPDVFVNGGDRTEENTPEVDICNKLGIKMIFNAGGIKTQSSSNLLDEYAKD